jgi:hypothetical protein
MAAKSTISLGREFGAVASADDWSGNKASVGMRFIFAFGTGAFVNFRLTFIPMAVVI